MCEKQRGKAQTFLEKESKKAKGNPFDRLSVECDTELQQKVKDMFMIFIYKEKRH